MYIERELSEKVLSAAKHFPAVVMTGARQVGKSTFLKHLFPNYNYVTLDAPLTAEEAETNPEVFLKKHKPPVIIDEIQYAPGLFRHLKSEIDVSREKRGSYILTGSQKFGLMKGVSESLAGRVAIMELEGLSIRELHKAKRLSHSLEDQMALFEKGGFPQLWVEDDLPLDLFYSSYTGTYLERDVRQLLAVNSLRDFERFLRSCAIRSGQILNKSELARDVGISVSTAGEWLGVLHALGHVYLLEPWFSNLGKRLSKSPKLYLADVGMLCHLLGVRGNKIIDTSAIGAIWETFVFGELRKQMTLKNKNLRLWFYRDQSQTEVDFILEDGFDLTLFECKWGSNPPVNDSRSMTKVAEILKQAEQSHYKVVNKILLSRATQEVRWSNGTILRPLHKALEGI